MRHIIVRGAGLAGLTFARSLLARTLGRHSKFRVTVVESRDRVERAADRGIGLWPAAVRALEELDVDVNSVAPFSGPPAAYRNIKGEWLSRCSEELAKTVNVRTSRENRLLKAIYSDLPRAEAAELQFKKKILSVEETENGVTVKTDTGEIISGEVFVSAEGSVVGPTCEEANGFSDTLSGIVPNVDSGLRDVLLGGGPFETLVSSRVRVAVVPLGSDSFFWFVTAPELTSLESDAGNVVFADVEAVVRAALSDCHLDMEKIIAMSDPSTLLIRRTAHRHFRKSNSGRFILCGDSCNFLANNLAQGGAVAIEDGYMLGRILGDAIINDEDIAGGLHVYESLRSRRVNMCHTMTRFTELLSRFPSAAECMKFVPPRLNSFVFDQCLIKSLGGMNPSETLRLASH